MLKHIAKSFNKAFAQHQHQAPFGFHGGLCLDTNKRALQGNASNKGIVEVAPPALVVIALIDYNKNDLTPLVEVNEQIKRGQVLATGIVSPVSGTVQNIEPRTMIHPDELQVLSVVVSNDGYDTPIVRTQALPDSDAEKLAQFIASPDTLLAASALAGLGGAGFPTAVKLQAAANGLQTLIINAAECEPEIACDEALMHSCANQIASGIDALVQLTQCNQCLVAIEDSKPLAIERLGHALENVSSKIKLVVIPTRYPTGAESPLIQTLTGKFIPHSEKPINHGVLCVNVATAHALWQAINGQALDSRIVSLGGAAMPNPCNVRVRFGTPVSHVLNSTNNAVSLDTARVRAGGPLSGYDLHSLDVPVTAKTNCLLAEPLAQTQPVQPCIRCGLCSEVCPAMLLPHQLHWYAQAEEHDKCKQLNLNACIECGCCDLVCPASIKLTETFRYAKSLASYLNDQQHKATEAEQRFKEREERLQRREKAKAAAIEQRKKTIKTRQTPEAERISAALARARSKRDASKDQ